MLGGEYLLIMLKGELFMLGNYLELKICSKLIDRMRPKKDKSRLR